MKLSTKLLGSVLVCLALAACNKAVEEKAPASEGNASDAENTNEVRRKLPECAQRNADSTYKNGSGCSAKEWVEWQDAR
mgnify:CR=1 FL=1